MHVCCTWPGMSHAWTIGGASVVTEATAEHPMPGMSGGAPMTEGATADHPLPHKNGGTPMTGAPVRVLSTVIYHLCL
ncbi:hypothetical protein BJY14_004229 [Actinomadura luteofluorescens]|uniref:Uncharacterized protein n=1 Tax=Actinomadura luteofluorescens TaxID=46163 RepID=A0A7Y9JH15_9ACTN|nr:hypothetical protein [Actinomadura luteofluorescens]